MKLPLSICGNRYHFTFKFIGLTCLFILLFSSLGVWQCSRAQQKRYLIHRYADRKYQQFTVLNDLFNSEKDGRFYSVSLKGRFDNQHHIFLDNKTYQGQAGYEIYTPFLPLRIKQFAILIDRGWVPAERDRSQLPFITPVSGIISLKGILNTPPAYFSLGAITESSEPHFPLRVQYINIKELTTTAIHPTAHIPYSSLAPYIVWLDPKDPHGFKREWAITIMGPERHILYAVQWFAFAISLLVLFVVLNLHRIEK